MQLIVPSSCVDCPHSVTQLRLGATQMAGSRCAASQGQSPSSAPTAEPRQDVRPARSVSEVAGEANGNAAASFYANLSPGAKHAGRPAAGPEALPAQGAPRPRSSADSVAGATSAVSGLQPDLAAVQRQSVEHVASTPRSSPRAQARAQSGRTPQTRTLTAMDVDADGRSCASPLPAPSPSGSRRQSSEPEMSPGQQPTPGSSQAYALDSFEVRSVMTWRDGSCAADQAVASAAVHFCALWDSEAFIQTALHQLSPGTPSSCQSDVRSVS